MEEQLQISQDKFCTMQRRMRDDDDDEEDEEEKKKKEEECQLKDQKLNVNAPMMMEASYSKNTHIHTCPWQPGLLTVTFTDYRLFRDNVPSTMTFIPNQT